MVFNICDLVFFKVKHRARYGCEGGSYYHNFDMNKPYLVTDIHGQSISIQDLTDKKFHFITDANIKFCSKEECKLKIRKLKLERIVNK